LLVRKKSWCVLGLLAIESCRPERPKGFGEFVIS
jgi:hypothetical protein